MISHAIFSMTQSHGTILHHVFKWLFPAECRYTKRVWSSIASWTAQPNPEPSAVETKRKYVELVDKHNFQGICASESDSIVVPTGCLGDLVRVKCKSFQEAGHFSHGAQPKSRTRRQLGLQQEQMIQRLSYCEIKPFCFSFSASRLYSFSINETGTSKKWLLQIYTGTYHYL